jgi:hypothetical protein
MSPLETGASLSHGSRRRARRRAREGGAIMFIVAMTLAVIGAMGMYALQMASTEIKTAGFIRQQVQTQYLAQYGVSASAQALTNNAQMYATIMTTQPDTGCYSLFSVYQLAAQLSAPTTPQALACHRAGSMELASQVIPQGGALPILLNPSGVAFSTSSDLTRGPVGIGTPGATLPTADFFVEVTDANQKQPPPGFATNASSPVCFLQITASTVGLTPTTSNTNAGDTFNTTGTPGFLSEGLETARARILFGPITCTGTK